MTAEKSAMKASTIWDSEALFLKAERHLEAMMEHPQDDWRFALASTFVLEFLARAALAYRSPALLADLKDWNNLYYALGHTPTAKRFSPRSIGTDDVLSRLKEIVPEFSSELEGFCRLHIGRRNAELHSGELAFDALQSSEWLPGFYSSSAVFLGCIGRSLADFLDPDELDVAEKLIAAAADEAAKAVQGTIKAHLTVWEGKNKEEQTLLLAQAGAWATKHAGHRVTCPACGSPAILTGDPISVPQKKITEDDLIIETQQYLPSKFECIACGMKLAGLSHLRAAGIGDAYKRTQTYDAAEYYAPEQEPMWEDDNNEPY